MYILIGYITRNESEILIPSPEINWGRNTYAPNGDLVDQKPGLIKVLTGGVMYSLQEDPNSPEYSLTTRPVDSSASKIFYGYPGSFFKASALAADDKPFELGDVDRLNQTVACIKRFMDTYLTKTNSLRIDAIGANYRSSLAQLLGEVPPAIVRRIAVLEDELKDLTGGRFPEIFLKIAEEMEELGLAEIQAEEMDLKAREHFFNVTPAWLRRVYG